VNAWKVILATLVIFGAGLVVGGLVVSHSDRLHAATSKPANTNSPANPSQFRLHELLRRMDRELALTPEQHEHIEKIMAESQERTQALWKPIAKEMSRETQSVCEAIREQLTPEQRRKFDAFSRQRQEHNRHPHPTNAPSLDGLTNQPATNAVTNQ
jgi:hypothetical protein